MLHALVQRITIRVDVTAQKSMMKHFGYLSDSGLPIFPLNTDGIDVRGNDVVVRQCNVENFDDSICVKPMTGSGNLTQCSENILFEDVNITLGVGATIGSVPPDPLVACVRNVTFRRIHSTTPIKALYIKPNPCGDPATCGTGIIADILYEDFVAIEPLWWSIWITTQQEDQPGNKSNTGCSFFYPLPGTTCPIDSHVPIRNLTLRNIHMTKAWLSPGVIRCSDKNPCTGFRFENVTIESNSDFPVGGWFLCNGLANASFVNTTPLCKPNFTDTGAGVETVEGVNPFGEGNLW